VRLDIPARTVCCYPMERGFVQATATLVRSALRQATGFGRARILFSAHGLPQRVVGRGDPYTWQVERTAEAVVAALAGEAFDWRVCYQSRVGPLEWTRPYVEDELARAAADRVPVVVVPIAFVAEHSETLVELDMEYRDQAKRLGVPAYLRVGTVGTDPAFIAGLVELVVGAAAGDRPLSSTGGGRLCPAGAAGCAFEGIA
jgi:protoporphyrin/coproporphyrin ferrochelatase